MNLTRLKLRVIIEKIILLLVLYTGQHRIQNVKMSTSDTKVCIKKDKSGISSFNIASMILMCSINFLLKWNILYPIEQ